MAIHVENLTKTFGDVVACFNINLEVGDNEIVVLLGPSGCGKTTTLRCIAGLEKHDRGSIFIGDREVTGLLPKDRNIAFVFQNIALFPHMTIRRNISFGLDVDKKIPKREINRKVQQVAEMLRIGELLDRKPAQLSGGQQQRAALGRAMIMEPNAFLLDEPLANLDANLKVEMRTEIHKLQRNLGISMIFVTHDQEEAMVLGDKIILMKDGRILQMGSPHEIYNDPVNTFVASFIGSPNTNLIVCNVSREGDEVLLDQGNFVISFNSKSLKKDIPDLPKLTLGIRPENILINPDSKSICKPKVNLIEQLGSRVVIYLNVDGFELRALVLPEKAAEITEGKKVDVSFDLNKAWFFNQEGERVL